MQTIKHPLTFVFATIVGLFILVSVVSAVDDEPGASCVPGVENIDILIAPYFGVTEEIGEFDIEIVSNLDKELYYSVRLYRGENAEGVEEEDYSRSRATGTMSGGLATVELDFSTEAIGKYYVQATVCNVPATSVADCAEESKIKEGKIIEFKNKFNIGLNCPPSGYVGETVVCEWEPEDVLTGEFLQSVTVLPPIVLQGEDKLSSPTSGNALTFVAPLVGSVEVVVTATADSYIDSTETTTVIIEIAGFTTKFDIGNTDYITLAETGISTGKHTLLLDVTEGSESADVRRIDSKIITPSGGEDGLIFAKGSDGWRTSYDFKQAGMKYIFTGTIEFQDDKKKPINFNYDIKTLGSKTEEEGSFYTWLIIGGSVIFLIIILVIVLIVVRKK